jgi:hypothetical protein
LGEYRESYSARCRKSTRGAVHSQDVGDVRSRILKLGFHPSGNKMLVGYEI